MYTRRARRGGKCGAQRNQAVKARRDLARTRKAETIKPTQRIELKIANISGKTSSSSSKEKKSSSSSSSTSSTGSSNDKLSKQPTSEERAKGTDSTMDEVKPRGHRWTRAVIFQFTTTTAAEREREEAAVKAKRNNKSKGGFKGASKLFYKTKGGKNDTAAFKPILGRGLLTPEGDLCQFPFYTREFEFRVHQRVVFETYRCKVRQGQFGAVTDEDEVVNVRPEYS